jgi:hypothetical protein
MRVIERVMMNAITGKGKMSLDNTAVATTGDKTVVTLHRHEIAVIDWTLKTLTIRDCGWRTPTTKSRLNRILALTGGNLYQKKGEWFLDGNPWNGEAIIEFHTGKGPEMALRADLAKRGDRIPDQNGKSFYGAQELAGNTLVYRLMPSGDTVLELANGDRATVASIDLE